MYFFRFLQKIKTPPDISEGVISSIIILLLQNGMCHNEAHAASSENTNQPRNHKAMI